MIILETYIYLHLREYRDVAISYLSTNPENTGHTILKI